MTNEEARDELVQLANHFNIYGVVREALDMAIKALSAQPEYTEQDMREQFNAGYACGMSAAQPEQQWILCSERMPDEEVYSSWYHGHISGTVLVTVGDIVTEAFTIDGVWNWDIYEDDYEEIPEKVTAWMPKPAPYKVGLDYGQMIEESKNE